MKGILERTKPRNVHLLGFSNSKFISYFKPYSCDTSSFTTGIRYGTLDIYLGQGKWRRLTKQDFMTRPSAELFKIAEDYGEEWQLLKHAEHWKNTGQGTSIMGRAAFKAWVKYSLETEKTFGTKVFLAVASRTDLQLLVDSYNFWVGR